MVQLLELPIAHIVFSFDSGWLTVHTLSCLSCRYTLCCHIMLNFGVWLCFFLSPCVVRLRCFLSTRESYFVVSFPLWSQTQLFPFHHRVGLHCFLFTKESDFVVSFHCGVRLLCFLSTAESDSVVSVPLQSQTLLFPFHCRVRLCCFLPPWSLTPLFTSTAESDSVVSFHPIVRLCWFLSTTESYSVVSFPLQSHTPVFPFHCRVGLCCLLPLWSLTPLFPSAMESDSVVSFHCGVWLCSVLPNGEESDSDIQMQISRQKQI